jgi:hypothetical protein
MRDFALVFRQLRKELATFGGSVVRRVSISVAT